MALTPEGRRLTEEHRRAQQQVRDDFLAEFIVLWALLDSARLDETGPSWVRAVMNLIRLYRDQSARLSTAYYWAFREAELPAIGVEPSTPPDIPRAELVEDEPDDEESSPRPERRRRGARLEIPRRPSSLEIPEPRRSRVRFDLDEDSLRGDRRRGRVIFEVPEINWEREDRAAEISLNVLGPIGQKEKTKRGQRLEEARDNSFVQSSGAASRSVFTGGRRSLMRLAEDDMQFVGYIRVTDGNPCAFCAMLASRGPVYPSKGAAGMRSNESLGEHRKRVRRMFEGAGAFKVHDHCACTIEPVYSTDTEWPGRAREFRQLWDDHIKGKYSGAEARREWRRLYERLQREARRQEIA